MEIGRNYFNSKQSEQSELVSLFVRRGGQCVSTAEATMISLAKDLRRSAKLKGFAPSLNPLLEMRGIRPPEYVNGFDCDGAIHPLGNQYKDGFKMLVKSNSSRYRIRFTMAHEVCHTLFYELVPELKFRNHEVDPLEERLCNIGAAALLMPAQMVKAKAKGLGASFDALDKLSALFEVSPQAMLLHLRFLGIWKSELSVWRLMSDGSFCLHRLIGGKKVEWVWSEPELLRRAWESGKLRGRTYLEYRDSDGGLKVRAVSYELTRRGENVLALWSHPSIRRTHPKMPLFDTLHASRPAWRLALR